MRKFKVLKNASMKEMVGGCCVCSDEHGWTENPLVYCDGQNCTVAVHQACYGIVTVPTGPWYCRKCESQERSARVRCELCPSRDGALKKTDNQGWAHVVCALYIPEVRFGNVTTMEPIILQLIPQERFAKTCYICTENSKPSRATAGACMQCNKSGCKQQFHVTCAQALGLLCEEAGNYLDNVKYCGYCQHHYSKLKKGGNVKTIPPYKPITHETGSSDSPSSPEKETTNSSQNISIIPSGSSSSSTTIKITQSSTSSSSVSIMPALPPATTSTSSSSSSKQRKSSSASKNSSNSSNSIINNMSSGSSASIGGGGGGGSTNQISGGGSGGTSKSNSSSTKDKEKHSKSVSSSKSSSKNDKNDLSSTSTANISNSSSSARDKRDSKSSKNSSSNSSNSNNKDDSLNINATSSSSNKISSSTQQGNILSSSSSSHKDSISSKTTALSTTTAISTQSENVLNVSQLQDPVQIYANTNSNTGSSSNVSINDINTSSNSNKGNSSTNNITSGSGGNTSGSGNTSIAKKRKAESSSSKSTTIDDLNKDLIKDVSVTIVPITNIDKLDSMDFEKNSKKSKTSDSSSTSSLSSASLQIINEPNLQNVSPNQNINVQQPVPQLPPPQSQQPNLKPSSLNINSSQSSTQSQSIIKPLKDVNDSRLHSTTGQQNSISPFSGAGSQLPQAPILPIVQQQQQPQQQQSSQSQQQQQSLVVSVPLSNAGVNIPSNNTIQTNNNQAIHQGSGLYQHMAQTREQLSASGSRASPIVNYQQNHQTSSIPSNLGRKSPLIQGAALSPSPHLNELNMHNLPLQQQPQQQQQQPNISVLQNVSPSLVNNSSAISGNCSNPNNSSSSGASIMTGSSSAIATTSDTGMLKITYEKQPNSRIAQLQDDIPARRSSSRSQSNESTKSRTSKKRALIPPSSSPSTATTSSSLSSSVFPDNNSASTSNSCHLSNNNNNSNSNNSVNNNNNSNNNNNKNSILSPSQFPPTIIGHQSNVHLTSVSAPPAANNNNNNANANNNNNNSNTANNHNSNNNKKQTAVSSRIQTNETPPPSTSRTPDTNYTTISYGGGLKFTYEAQPNTGTSSTQQPSSISTANPTTVIPPVSITPQPIKDSPPSSPGSEAGSRKRTRKSTESKNDVKIFQNGVVATHMLGNQINPASSVAQKMTDQLNMEIEAHSIYTSTSLDSGPQLVGPPYPGKSQSNSRSSSTQPGGLGSILSGSSSSSQSGNSHQSLEQLLERQWEQGSQFLMEQAQHFDIASLLSCLHQLRTENIRLEDHVNNLVARRDHLLAVNARLAIPLNPPVASQAQGPYNNMHINGPSDIPPNLSNSRSNRTSSSSQQSSQQQSHFNAQQPQSQSQIIENGVDFRGHGAIPASGHQIPTNPSSRHSSMSYTSTHNSSSSRQQQQQQSAISINIDQQQTSRNRTFQQTNYSTAHQPQLRPDDSQVKPS